MSLIKVEKIGFGITGDTLDITIAIPKSSYLTSFNVCNQNDLKDADCITIPGIDYIKIVSETEGITEEAAFKKIFDFVEEETDTITNNIWEIYKIKPDFEWANGAKLQHGIKVSQIDFTLVSMKVEVVDLTDFTPSTECGKDKTVEFAPLFTLIPAKLKALDSVALVEDCSFPKDFVNLLLIIRAIELAICCGDYCRASKYWDKLLGGNTKPTPKKCGCHE